jgi:integrase
MQVRHITTTEVRKFIATMQRKGSKPGTVRNAYRVLRPILQTAVESRCIPSNPCDSIRSADLPTPVRQEMLFLDGVQVRRLAEAIDKPYGALIYLAAYTGMRAGEIAALRMENVDLLRGSIRVCESVAELSREEVFGSTKNGRERTVLLGEELTRVLRDYLETQPAKGPKDFLFTGPPRHGVQIKRREDKVLRHAGWFYGQVFKPALTEAKLDTRLRFHDLRHTAAALMIANGDSPKAICDRLGHSTITVTMDRYGHLLPSVEEAVVRGLDNTFRAALSEPAPAPIAAVRSG